jgi:uncharacterized protein YacL (UPF0231 family)
MRGAGYALFQQGEQIVVLRVQVMFQEEEHVLPESLQALHTGSVAVVGLAGQQGKLG